MSIERKIRALGGVGILEAHDLTQLSAATRRVYHLMSDGRWYTRHQICLAAGRGNMPASEGLRRMRELRLLFEVERRRSDERRDFQYRLKEKAPKIKTQQELFNKL